MTEPLDRKLYLGPRIRRLRRELGLNQTQMAGELGVSPSYLNHLERNQRPLTAQFLMRLATTYDIDVRNFVSGQDGAILQNLAEVFRDPLLSDLGASRSELGEIAENHPSLAEAVVRLYSEMLELRRLPNLVEQTDRAVAVSDAPLNWLRERIQERQNQFPALDDAAEQIGAELGQDPVDKSAELKRRLRERGVDVRVLPDTVLIGALRHYDPHRKRLMLSERLTPQSRLMSIAFQVCQMELQPLISALVAEIAPPSQSASQLLTIALCNYAAAAIVMPYGAFHSSAEESSYDIDLLAARFGVSFEHVAHRLTTLNRSLAKGVPFFMLRIDAAGNVSKRFAGDAFPFARFGGICPRWNVHAAFQTPGKILTQIIETPDGSRYFTLSRTISRAASRNGGVLAIGLGCELKHASRIIYARGLSTEPDAITAVGPACRLCERRECPDRAEPPLNRTLEMSAYRRASEPFPFS